MASEGGSGGGGGASGERWPDRAVGYAMISC